MCDDEFGVTEAQTVCKQLQLSDGEVLEGFGSDNALMWLDSVTCTADDTSLADCTMSDWTYCNSGEAVGVVCNACPEGEIHLTGVEGDDSQGRVEICHEGQWGKAHPDNT